MRSMTRRDRKVAFQGQRQRLRDGRPPRRRRRSAAAEAAVGIDLGTTQSLVCVIEDGEPMLVPDEHGDVCLPSVVHYGATGRGAALAGQRQRCC